MPAIATPENLGTSGLAELPALEFIPDVHVAPRPEVATPHVIDLTTTEAPTPDVIDLTTAGLAAAELAASAATVSDTAFGPAVDSITTTAALVDAPEADRTGRGGAIARVLALPAWVVLLVCDVVGMMLPALFAHHGRVELLAMTSLSVVLFQGGGLYRPKLKVSALDDLPKLAVRLVLATLLLGAFTSLTNYPPYAGEFFTMAAFSVALAMIFRCLGYSLICRARAAGRFGHDTIVIGSGEVAERIVRRLVTDRSYGLRPVSVLSTQGMESFGDPRFGFAADVRNAITETGARVLIVATGREPESELVGILRSSRLMGCEVFVVPRLFEVYNYGQTDHIGAVPVVRLPRRGLHDPSLLAKRLIDIVVSSVALILASPVLLVAAIAVRTEGPGSVIFRQVRVGRDGRHFELLKFRSLKPVDDTESATRWNVANDNRMGSVGRLLRRTSIDELPQLINIIKGDMTLVGPRPERPHFAKAFSEEIPEYQDRHRVPVGLTGLAQVSGLRGDTSIVDRARYDNFYIDNWTLWLDIKIICGTLREVVGARGR